MRTVTSLLGIALGVVLIVITVGLARGMLYEAGQREVAVGAELMFQSSAGAGPGVGAPLLSVPIGYCRLLREVQGVRSVTPVGRYLRSGAGGIGFELIEGIADAAGPWYSRYADIAGIRVAEGRDLAADDEILIDRRHARNHKLFPGSSIELLGATFRVAGIYEPEIGARTKMRLSVLERLLGASEKCSYILVKCRSPEEQQSVAQRILDLLPGNSVIFTSDIPNFFDRGFPSLNVFLKVVVGLSTVVSALVILLAMYTSVAERTREIGIMKSMGASQRFIITAIEKEAFYISAVGVLSGMILGLLVEFTIARWTTLILRVELKWALIAAAVGLGGGVLGALYPAWRAARFDAVKALSYE